MIKLLPNRLNEIISLTNQQDKIIAENVMTAIKNEQQATKNLEDFSKVVNQILYDDAIWQSLNHFFKNRA